LEHPHRSALENHVHRTPRLGNHGLLNVRIGIRDDLRKGWSDLQNESCTSRPAGVICHSMISPGDFGTLQRSCGYRFGGNRPHKMGQSNQRKLAS
jgi:hypothetical protein